MSWEPPEPSHAWVDWEALSLAADCDEFITSQPVTGAARAAYPQNTSSLIAFAKPPCTLMDSWGLLFDEPAILSIQRLRATGEAEAATVKCKPWEKTMEERRTCV